jgi:hypothetical protein
MKHTLKRMPPGMFQGLSMSEYQAAEGISKSALDLLADCPLLYSEWAAGKFTRPTTRPMELGTALHSMVLGDMPDYTVRPAYYADGKRWHASATFCKKWEKERAGELVVSEQENRLLLGAAKSVLDNRRAYKLLNACQMREVSIFAKDPDTGLTLKGRIDFLGATLLGDLKTTRYPATDAFSKEIVSRRYHVQAAMYKRILSLLGEPRSDWYFIMVSLMPPHRVNVRKLRPLAVAQGETILQENLRLLADCLSTNRWPGLDGDPTSDEIGDIDIPSWAQTDATIGDLQDQLEEMGAEQL